MRVGACLDVNAKRITSASNQAVKEAIRLKRKRHRYSSHSFLAEGEDLLDAALKRGIVPRQVFVLEGEEGLVEDRLREAAAPRPGRSGVEVEFYICGEAVMEKLSELGSGSRRVALFEMIDRKFPGGLPADFAEAPPAGPFLYLAGIGDPGNLGTLIRAAASLGAAAVALGPGTADPYSPKALRATMGALFELPLFITVNPESLVAWAEKSGLAVICADAHRGGAVWDAGLAGPFVLVLGSEREGVPHRLLDAASDTVRIPQSADTESINVAMAGTAILYEAARQRAAAGD